MSLLVRAGMLLALGLLPALSSRAQPQHVAFERVTEADGLPGGAVNGILQDRQGFMWFGTWEGLARYDGYAFTHFRHDPLDSTSISDFGQIEWLYEDSKGYIWLGLYGGGLNRLVLSEVEGSDPATEAFTRFRHDPDDPGSVGDDDMVNYIYEDRNGFIWIGFPRRGLDRYDPGTGRFTHYRHDPDDPSSLSDNSVRVIYEDSHGVLWIGTGAFGRPGRETGGLNRYDPERDAFVRYLHVPDDPNSLSDNWVQAIHEDSRGTLWIGTEGNGLNTYDRERDAFTRLTDDPDDTSRPHLPRPILNVPVASFVAFVHEDHDGMLWIGSHNHGLYRYDPTTGTQTHYEHDPDDPSSLGDNRVFRICESHDGTLWIGTFGGLFKVNPGAGRFQSYRHDPNDPTTVGAYIVADFHVDRSGDLWVGTNRGGLQRLNRESGTFTSFPMVYPGGKTTDYTVSDIYEDRSGTLWVGLFRSFGSPGALWTLDRRSGRMVPSGLAITPPVGEIYEDEEGVLWIGTREGLYRYDRRADTLAHFRHEQQNVNLRVPWDRRAILEGRDGALWHGTEDGLARFDRATHTYTTVLEDMRVSALEEAPHGALWVATMSHGLLLYDPETGVRTSYTTADGLAHNAIGAMLADDRGFLWLSTEQGLSRFDVERRTFHNYDVSAGMPGNDFSKSAAKGRSGELYFGGTGGFVTVYPELLDAPPPRVALTGLRYTDRSRRARPQAETALPTSPAETLRLPYAQNDLTFEYVGLHFAYPAGNRYAYMLEGYEDEWRTVGAQRTATYTNLSPGTYTFRVRAANADGVWSEEAASLAFVILPPWWRTAWAYALYALLFAAAVFAVDRLQRRRLLRKERERARIQAAEERAEVLQELDYLKTRFFVNLSHEFRTPLTLVLGPLHDALDGAYGDLTPRQRAHLSIMQRNGARLLQLLNQLLDLSRLEAGSMTLHARRADVVPLLRRTVAAFASRAERRQITLQFHAEDDEIELHFEADKLEKVLTNLLSNALKFTPEHGKVRVNVAVGQGAAGSYVEIVVKDTGPGIASDQLELIFDRFHQVDGSTTRAQEGTGIGLALVKELVALHGGTVRVESEVGFGTVFTVRLPQGRSHLTDAEVLDEAPEAVQGEEVDGYGTRALAASQQAVDAVLEAEGDGVPDAAPADAPVVLIVEDNPDMRAYLRSHLGASYRIEEADDGEAGLARARELVPALVISDVMMPRMDGYALCRAIKTDPALEHIPVILLTAKVTDESKLEGLELGADAYLSKPFNMEELMVRVENLIGIRRRLRRRFSREVVIGPSEVVVSSEEAAFLEQVREVVERHMGDSTFGVEALAEEVGLGRRQLQRRLQALTDLSPSGYLRMMRLERASQLLEQQAGRVSEVAYAVGFGSAAHFSRVFRQVFGVPPSEYPVEAEREERESHEDMT